MENYFYVGLGIEIETGKNYTQIWLHLANLFASQKNRQILELFALILNLSI